MSNSRINKTVLSAVTVVVAEVVAEANVAPTKREVGAEVKETLKPRRKRNPAGSKKRPQMLLLRTASSQVVAVAAEEAEVVVITTTRESASTAVLERMARSRTRNNLMVIKENTKTATRRVGQQRKRVARQEEAVIKIGDLPAKTGTRMISMSTRTLVRMVSVVAGVVAVDVVAVAANLAIIRQKEVTSKTGSSRTAAPASATRIKSSALISQELELSSRILNCRNKRLPIARLSQRTVFLPSRSERLAEKLREMEV